MMICPRCGAVYQDAAFCPKDGTPLVPQPDAAPPPKPKKRYTALIVAIVLVVAVAGAGLFVARDKLGILGGGPQVTDTAPSSAPPSSPSHTGNWTRGVTPLWSQQFVLSADSNTVSILVQTPQVWVVGGILGIRGVDPNTGQVIWQHDFNSYYPPACANTLADGKVACLEPDQSQPNNAQTACLIDAQTGEQSCAELTGADTLPPGHLDYWDKLWVSGDSLLVAGEVWVEDPYSYNRQVTRLTLPSLTVDWVKTYNPTCDSASEPAPRQLDMSGITGNVLWFSGPNDEGPSGLAIDIRNGEPLFAQCDVIYPLADGTFLAAPTVPAGPMTLPGGGSITIVNSGGAIEYVSGQLPAEPVYYVPSGDSSPYGDDLTDGTLGLGGTAWPVTVPLQQVMAGGGGQFLTGAASGYTLVVAGNAGQISAVDYRTGRPMWSATVPAVEYYSSGGYTNLDVAIIGNVVVVTPASTQDGEVVTLLGLATGQTIEKIPGQAFASPENDMLGVVSGHGAETTVTRYVPGS